MAKVSVIVPTYNRARVLPKAIQSVLDQTFQDFEILVVDDGSTDETQAVVIRQFGDAVRYFYKENGGVASARNCGIARAWCAYIAFLDSDDLWLPQKLALQVAYLDQHPNIALAFSDTLRSREGEILPQTFFQIHPPAGGHVFQHLMQDNFIATLTVVVRKAALDEVGSFENYYITSEDYDLWLRIAARFQIGYIDQPLAIYSYSPDSLIRNQVRGYGHLIEVLECALQAYPDLSSSVFEETQRRIEHLHYLVGRYALIDGDLSLAREKMIQAIRKRPCYWKAYVFYILARLRTLKEKLALAFQPRTDG